MRDQIIAAMARDLKIVKYSGESEGHYINRVLYSGLACWIKASTFDSPLVKLQHQYNGVSKKHIHDKCEKVLSEFLARFPTARSWFYGNENNLDPIAIVRQRLFGSQDLIDIGFQTNVGLINEFERRLTRDLVQVQGIFFHCSCYYSGVSTIRNIYPQNSEAESNNEITSTEWLLQYIKKAWWKKGAINDEHMEYFDASQQSVNNTLWKTNKANYVSGLILSRRPVNKSSYEYILEKHTGGEVYHHRVDPFLQETREYRRMMFALRSLANNPAPVWISGDLKGIHMKLRVHLPNKEHTTLESFAWPHNLIDDKLEWDMPYDVWPFIKNSLVHLGLKVMEELHG